ncbi:MAG: hypothetical protein GY928_11545 [Colwellia sp.]|nr:hypothetical protein [Colwellia sp.]
MNMNTIRDAQIKRITSTSSKPIREAVSAIAGTITGTAVILKQVTDYGNIALAKEIDSLINEDDVQPSVEAPIMSNADIMAMAKQLQALQAQAQ